MSEIQDLKGLLLKVSDISKKYEEKAKESGENYNVFNILGLSTREVRTHSAFIADLLDPEGLHGEGSIFLELFIEQIKSKINFEIKNSAYNNAKIEKEKYISEKNNDNTEGGDMDIVIEIDNKAIIIENKIYAVDQKCQLVRYYNYGISLYSKNDFALLYLTLDEQEASNCSIDCNDKDCIEKKENNEKVKEIKIELPKKTRLDKNIDFINITYKEDIKNWLEKCLKQTEDKTFFTETLKQYINLVKQLTGQAMSDEMRDEITKIVINKPLYVEAAFYIEENIFELKKELTKKVVFKFKEHFENKGYKCKTRDNFGIDQYIHLIVYKRNEDFGFGFSFEGNYWNGFFFGIKVINETYNKNIFEELKRKSIANSTVSWPYNDYCKYRNWDKEVFIKIVNEEFSQYLIEKIENVIHIYDNIKENNNK